MTFEKPYLCAVDAGTASIRVGLFDAKGRPIAFSVKEYATVFPKPGWAEQDPDEWWRCLVAATRESLKKGDVNPKDVAAISVDGTSSTVVCLDENGHHLRSALLWMDNRSSLQSQQIFNTNHPVLKRSLAGVSAEWMIPKLLWLKDNDADTFERTRYFMEQADYLTYRLTGLFALSINHITHRWFYNDRQGGWPVDFYNAIGLKEVVRKFPTRILRLGELAGELSSAAGEAMGLRPGTRVAEGGCDAYVGMLGLDVTKPGRAAFIAGSSHLVLPITDKEINIKGIFGAHPDCVIPGLFVLEGGQVSSGSIVKWFKDNFAVEERAEAQRRNIDPYDVLTEKAAKVPIGSEGLIVMDYWQGNRNPYTDYRVQGAIWGLTLKHRAEHVFRAILEGVAFGTENILRTLSENGLHVGALYISGGTAKSEFWLQMHADVSNIPIYVPEFTEATILGTAICAATGAGIYKDLAEAAGNMVRVKRVVEPKVANHSTYEFYFDKYRRTYPALREMMYEMSDRPDR